MSGLHSILTFPTLRHAKRDVPASVVVFLVALPLCLGIALASGAPLFAGVVAGVVGGLILTFFSGSEISVSGPAAGLAVIVFGAIQRLGSFETFLAAVVISGVLQIGFSIVRAGVAGNYVPNSVIKGMLAAIGIVIILKQIPHAVGYDADAEGDFGFLQADGQDTFSEILVSANHIEPGSVVIALLSLAVLILWERPFMKRQTWTGIIPAPLICVALGIIINNWFHASASSWALQPGSSHMVTLPVLSSISEAGTLITTPVWSAFLNIEVWIIAVTLAVVGALETLLSVEAADKLDPQKRISDTNRELRAQGIGNTISGLLGGLPITAVIVRSSANVYAGAQTRLSSILHGAQLLGAVILTPFLLNQIPLSALAAVLLMVGYKLSSIKIIKSMAREGKVQFIPFAVTVISIVFTDLLTGIGIGLVTSIVFVIRTNIHRAVTTVSDGEGNVLIRFNKDVSFVNKPELKEVLRKLPEGSHVIIDGIGAAFIDRDVYETLDEFDQNASYRGLTVEYRHVFNKLHA
jgi:MFS superfamily sulfate permease-like transporter